MAQPFYHLRPNKYIDRHLFVGCLEVLNRTIKLSTHRYIGFGSYSFEDFKQIHDRLRIRSMISLESDSIIFQRAKFNKPYKCIRILNQTSTDFIASENWGNKKTIIWLDYTEPKSISNQFSDIASLTNVVQKHDIIRITLNGNISSLGNPDGGRNVQQYRLERLKERIGEYTPVDLSENDMTFKKYPITLLKCLKKMIEGLFVENQFDKRFFLPLFSTVYADGQMMVTLTGIVLNDHKQEKEIKQAFKDYDYVNFEWLNPSQIQVPELTVKEMLEINKLLPSHNAQEQLIKHFSFVFSGKEPQEINSYVSYYHHYPSFQNVTF